MIKFCTKRTYISSLKLLKFKLGNWPSKHNKGHCEREFDVKESLKNPQKNYDCEQFNRTSQSFQEFISTVTLGIDHLSMTKVIVRNFVFSWTIHLKFMTVSDSTDTSQSFQGFISTITSQILQEQKELKKRQDYFSWITCTFQCFSVNILLWKQLGTEVYPSRKLVMMVWNNNIAFS